MMKKIVLSIIFFVVMQVHSRSLLSQKLFIVCIIIEILNINCDRPVQPCPAQPANPSHQQMWCHLLNEQHHNQHIKKLDNRTTVDTRRRHLVLSYIYICILYTCVCVCVCVCACVRACVRACIHSCIYESVA